MVFRRLIGAARRYRPHWLPALAATHRPLIDGEDLRRLSLYAQALPQSLFAFKRQASATLIGETLSPQRGRGFEFAEHRAYQPGDEARSLNWRLYARTRELHTRVFTEERRPQVMLLVDRRASMRFGTRYQLKATLAARIGACFAYHARHHTMPVGGVLLDETTVWFGGAIGETGSQPLIHALAAPCPPLPFTQAQPSLVEALRLLIHRLPAGAFVLLVSDFSDLDPPLALPLLRQLAELHTVRAMQVLDPAELSFPRDMDVLIEDAASSTPLRFYARDERPHAAYHAAFARHLANIEDAFSRCQIAFERLTTQSDVETCLGSTPCR